MKGSRIPDKHTLTQDIPANGSADRKNPNYIVPPGLSEYIYLFEAHYDSAGKMPIIVVGDTGVGKRLFLHLFEKLYMEKENSDKVLYVNCANLGGGDRNMAKGDLFGYVKGAYTGADKDTFGFLKVADGGALILDEIGELPPEVQTMLLTFIETGKYHVLGSTKEMTASVRIIAATNDLKKLSEPFRERFYIFYVPPLHQRRRDVLYYLWWLHPETIKELMHWEVLALLAHNWPGNVREIDKVGRFLKRKKRNVELFIGSNQLLKENPVIFSMLDRSRVGTKLMGLDKSETSFDPNPILSLYQNIEKRGVDVKALERLLNSKGVGLNSKKPAFPTVLEFNIDTLQEEDGKNYLDTLKRLDVLKVKIDKFDEAYRGYEDFCYLFFQDISGNHNNALVNECTSTAGHPSSLRLDFYLNLEDSIRALEKYKKLEVPIFRFLTGIEIPAGREIPDNSSEREVFCLDLLRNNPSNAFLAPLKERYPIEEKREQEDIWSMKYEELLRYYYEGLIERTGGNKREAAKRIGVNYQTFNSRYRSLFKEEGNSKRETEHQSSRRRRRGHP